jgi:hypothetical protein
VTETRGETTGQRIVRGREAECRTAALHHLRDWAAFMTETERFGIDRGQQLDTLWGLG